MGAADVQRQSLMPTRLIGIAGRAVDRRHVIDLVRLDLTQKRIEARHIGRIESDVAETGGVDPARTGLPSGTRDRIAACDQGVDKITAVLAVYA